MGIPAHKTSRLEELGQMMRQARGPDSQEYFALRLGHTKGWLSRIEAGILSISPSKLGEFAKLVRWSEEELKEAFSLLGEKVDTEKQEPPPTLKQNLLELGKLTDSPNMACVMIRTLESMSPFPTPPFLQFMEDFVAQAQARILALKKAGN